MYLDDLLKEIKDRWSDDPAGRLCEQIVKYLYNEPTEKLKMLTYLSIRDIAGAQNINDDVIRAVMILVNSRFHALEQLHLYIDDDENEFEISNDQVREALRTGRLVHPETGEIVPADKSKIVPFFVPSPEFLKIKEQ